MEPPNRADIEQRAREAAPQRTRVRDLVEQGKWLEAEPEEDRRLRYIARRISKVPGAESLVGDTIDLQGVNFLAEGAQIRRAVAHLDVTGPTESEIGTGFLISPRLLITNWHVVPDTASARGTLVTFDREIDFTGAPAPETSFGLDPDAFFISDESLDYAVIALGPRKSGSAEVSEFGFCPLSDDPDKHVLGMNVNIIQHPMGRPKMIAVRKNLLVHRTDRTLLYETDTEVGSSGSPVFNDDWDLVALHHWGKPHLDEQPDDPPRSVNEGIRISVIYRDLATSAVELAREQRALIDAALAGGGSMAPMRPSGRVLTPPGRHTPTSAPEAMPAATSGLSGTSFTIPIEVHVTVGGTTSASVGTMPVARAKVLRSGAEALRVDTDYTNRMGYDPSHIPGTNIPLPKVRGGASSVVAPLRASEPDAAKGELRYEHFSVKMNRHKRMALYSATNIDGRTYLEVDRDTGQVVHEEESEKWFLDPRISASYFIDQPFYSEWSHLFDRGHITRRSDPTWGDDASAERANADTFHFTNCSPQHWMFNQRTRYWQGAERYILEKGVLAQDPRKSISVFQGPIFDDDVDYWADDVQLPSMFFKIVVWPGAQGLKSVGMIVTQSTLYGIVRGGYQPPGPGRSTCSSGACRSRRSRTARASTSPPRSPPGTR